MGQLMRIVQGEGDEPSKFGVDRRIAKKAQGVVDNVRLAALKADGVVALAGHIMEEFCELDGLRVRLAKGDLSKNMLMAEIEETAFQQVMKIQRGVDGFGL